MIIYIYIYIYIYIKRSTKIHKSLLTLGTAYFDWQWLECTDVATWLRLPDITLLGGARFITWRLRHSFFGPRDFWRHWACLGYGSVPGTHIKKGLVPYSLVCGVLDQYRRHQRLLSVRIVTCCISDKIKDYWLPTNPHYNQYTAQSSPRYFHHKTKNCS